MINLIILVVLSQSQLAPGPLDAFRANYASMKAELDFEFTGGAFRDNQKRLWLGQLPVYVESHTENTDLTLVGHWACDGKAEYYRFGSPADILQRASKDQLKKEAGKVFYNVSFIPRTELLWDGELLVGHREHPHFKDTAGNPDWTIVRANIIDDMKAGYLGEGRGPLQWTLIFPHILKFYDNAPLSRHHAIRWGNPTEVETRRKEGSDGNGWEQIEVSFDPSIGYLPRFVRFLSYYSPGDVASVGEMYLIEARPCAAGGFVPTEWFDIIFDVPNFRARFPDYDESTDLAAPMNQVNVTHFRASNFRDFPGPVALREVRDVRSVAGIGGFVKSPPDTSSLSLGDVKKLLGPRLNTPAQRLMLNIDTAELRELEGRSSLAWWPYVVGLAVSVILTAAFLRRRRSRAGLAALGLAVLGGTSGCGVVGNPVIKLTAGFRDTFRYISPQTHELSMTMVVRNDGNQTLRLLKADGGCSCRKVDQSTFPVVVRPGGMITVPVQLSIVPSTGPQSSPFQFETDRGTIGVSAPFFTLMSHELNPDTVVNSYMNENDGWSFDLTYRVIFRADGIEPDSKVRVPGKFVAVQEAERRGRVGGTSDYAYRETTYRVTLTDRELGEHKASIAAVSPQGDILLEAPVVWKRVPYLSCVPDRVILGTRPVRAFLRCPDDGVELTKVLAAPEGVKAVVSSTREVTVMLGEDAPDIVNGTLEVGTTAQHRPPLRIPVVRFRSSIGNSLSLRTGTSG